MKISFKVLPIPHPPSKWHGSYDKNTYEVALSIEKDTNMLSNFVTDRKREIQGFFVQETIYLIKGQTTKEMMTSVLEEKIKNLWREYMIRGEHGLTSERANAEGTVGYIDTSAYYQAVQVEITGM